MLCDPKQRSTFKYFIILIVSTNYIFVHKLDNKLFICLPMVDTYLNKCQLRAPEDGDVHYETLNKPQTSGSVTIQISVVQCGMPEV